jgi:hypothetical protein
VTGACGPYNLGGSATAAAATPRGVILGLARGDERRAPPRAEALLRRDAESPSPTANFCKRLSECLDAVGGQQLRLFIQLIHEREIRGERA